jgi:hypothetical protein
MPSRGVTVRLLLALLAVMGVAALAGSWLLLSHRAGSDAMPRAWLAGSPFRDYLIPGVALGLLVGAGFLVGAAVVLAGHPLAGWLAALLGLELIAWIVIQVAIVGPRSPLQPLCAAWGAAVALLGLWLARFDDRASGSRGSPARRGRVRGV